MNIKENILTYWNKFITSKSRTGLSLYNEPSRPDERFYKRLAKAGCEEQIDLIAKKQDEWVE